MENDSITYIASDNNRLIVNTESSVFCGKTGIKIVFPNMIKLNSYDMYCLNQAINSLNNIQQ